jgi:N-acetylglucosamine kinase-like BadF-type ATPase
MTKSEAHEAHRQPTTKQRIKTVTELYIGIDLGGSGTRAALAMADGEVLATGVGGPSGAHGGAAGRRHIERALDAALAPIAPRPKRDDTCSLDTCSVYVGLRGLSVPGRRDAVAVYLSARLPQAQVKISNDATIALWGGLGGGDGVAVLAGTGSIAVARLKDGREARSGGYGYLVSDEGSGYWLGREALAACLRALDGRGPPTQLSKLVSEATNQQTQQGLVGWLYSGTDQVPRIAGLAPLVTRAAQDGDRTALDIVQRAADALAELAIAAATHVWPDGPPRELAVACCGGVWAAGDVLRRPFTARFEKAMPVAMVTEPALPPVGGAILLAMGADRIPVAQSVVAHLRASVASPRGRRS